MKECPQCHAAVADDAKFCMECGFNIKKYEEEQKPRFCPQCGTPHKGGKFCVECGHQFAASTTDKQQSSMPSNSNDVFANDWLFEIKKLTTAGVKEEETRREREKWERLFVDFNYTEQTDGSVTITGLKDKRKLSLTVPYGVVAIADETFKDSECLDIALPKSLVKIGARSFFGCRFLKSIVLPASLQAIGDEAFANCTALEIALPNRLKMVGRDVIKNTAPERRAEQKRVAEEARLAREAKEAEERRLAEEERKAARFVIDGKTLTKYAGTDTDVVIPSHIKCIAANAFKNGTNIRSITVPSSVIRIEEAAFNGCSNLESITLPFVGDTRKTGNDSYQHPFGYIFGSRYYDGSEKVKQLSVSHPSKGFEGWTPYASYIPKTLKSVTITDGNILPHAFCNCRNLTSIVLPLNISYIGERAFSNCASLASVIIPPKVEGIYSCAFKGCTSLSSVSFSTNNKTLNLIGDHAFSGCTNLTSIVIPQKVHELREGVFENCENLASITFEDPNWWVKRDSVIGPKYKIDLTDPVRNVKLLCHDYLDSYIQYGIA